MIAAFWGALHGAAKTEAVSFFTKNAENDKIKGDCLK